MTRRAKIRGTYSLREGIYLLLVVVARSMDQTFRPNTQAEKWQEMKSILPVLGSYQHISYNYFSPVELEYPSQYFRIECIIMSYKLGSKLRYQPEKDTVSRFEKTADLGRGAICQ